MVRTGLSLQPTLLVPKPPPMPALQTIPDLHLLSDAQTSLLMQLHQQLPWQTLQQLLILPLAGAVQKVGGGQRQKLIGRRSAQL